MNGPQDINIPVQPVTSTPGDIFQPNSNLGYTAILHNSDVATLDVQTPAPAGDTLTATYILVGFRSKRKCICNGSNFCNRLQNSNRCRFNNKTNYYW